jgi:hypothetical protein
MKADHRMVESTLKGTKFLGIRVGGKKQKNAGLKAVTLIATLNPVSQVLW